MVRRTTQGLTATYNRFHDPEEHGPDVLNLRELHAADGPRGARRLRLDRYSAHVRVPPRLSRRKKAKKIGLSRKKPWRYRWPDEIRDEVLARLLELNRVRAEEEQLSGAAAEANSKSRANRQPRKSKKNQTIGTGSLLDSLPEEGQS